jgi:AcrR family transcriptional regulator
MDARLIDLDVVDGVIPARQARSREAQERILRAGEAVFARVGYDAAHVNEIAAAANCSIGSFYRRFRDKEALFRALQLEFALRGIANIDRFFDMPRWREAPVEETIRNLIRNTARAIERNSGFFRALFQRSIVGAAIDELPSLRRADAHAGRRLAALLRERRAADGDDLEELCIFALKGAESILIQQLLLHGKERGAITSASMADALTRMMCGYIGIRPVSERKRSR